MSSFSGDSPKSVFTPVPRKTYPKKSDAEIEKDERKKTGEFHQFKLDEIRERRVVPSSVFEGYAEGSIVSLLGSPKTGKTNFAMQECIHASKTGYDSLYIYNESPRYRFSSIMMKKMKMMSLGELDLSRITMCNMNGEVLRSANYDNIDTYMRRAWAGKMRYWLEHYARRPRFVVIDSISKVGRVYIPQLFKVMEVLCDELINIMTSTGKYPVVLILHQKSGGYWEKFDDSVVGGAGMIHETDTSIVLKRLEINKKLADETGLRWGSKVYTITVDSRDIDCSPFERVLKMENGYVKAEKPLFEVTERKVGFHGKQGWSN